MSLRLRYLADAVPPSSGAAVGKATNSLTSGISIGAENTKDGPASAAEGLMKVASESEQVSIEMRTNGAA